MNITEIFIKVYHMVKKVIDYPKDLMNRMKQEQISREKKEEDEEKNRRLIRDTMGTVTANDTGDDDKKEDKVRSNLFTFDYTVKDASGKQIKGSFDAKSLKEVEAFLINEGYEVINVAPQKKNALTMDLNLFGNKLKSGDLSFILTQLATYLRAGIPLVDSVRILSRQTEKPAKRKIYDRIVYDLVAGEKFSTALENQDTVFPRLLINMVKASEMTGDLPQILDEMAEYYTSIDQTKKQMISALTYPLIVLVVSFVVVIFCLIYVVPNFVKMYSETESSLPGITVFTMKLSSFFSHHYITIILLIAAILIGFITAYQNIKYFRKRVQTVAMKMPIIGKIIIYSEVSMFTRTFAQLLNHSVHITDTMSVLSKISNNEVYKEIISNTLDTLSKGGKISESFRGQWAFPIVAYEMLVTGEETGKLGNMMEKVAEHYSNLHKNAITTVKSLLEPMTILFLAFAVGFILLSVVIPMFDIYGAVGTMS